MNTKTMEQFTILDTEILATVEGGWFPWGGFFSGAIGALDGGSQTLDQLNGKWPKKTFPTPCGPYGMGGTPNACNGF